MGLLKPTEGMTTMNERPTPETDADTPWHSNGETKDEWFARQREKYIVLKRERNKALQQSEIWAKQVSEAIRQVEASDALYRKQCGQLEAMREVLRTIRRESAKIFRATAGLPDCGLIYRVATAALDNRQDLSAWWMYDNHTFRRLDLTGDWRGDTLACFETDPHGSFFVRDTNDRTIFHLPGRGRGRREEFIAALAAWSPQDAKDQPTNPAE